MPVNSDKWTDARLNAMEKRISGIYSRASKELAEKTEAHFKAFEEKDKAKIKALEAQKGKVPEDEYKKAEAEYQRWRRTQLFQGEQMKELEKTVAAEMLNANKTAVAYVNGELPEVYSINYNGIGDDIASHVKGYSYQLVDAHTVRNLAAENKTLLPYKTVNGKKDARWNTKKVNAEVLQGVVQGESIPKIASRLEKVTEMNRASAIRNARTSVTSAQNRGRLDGMLEAEKKGIILKKEWISSNQSGRTRDWHFPSSFESLEVDVDKPFVNGMGKIMYPGDPSAKPANVYNCRCTMAAVVKGFKKVENTGESVDFAAKSGIINTREFATRLMPNGLRTSATHTLTDADIKKLKNDISAIEADESVFEFNNGRVTCYNEDLDKIFVRGDVLPDLNSIHPRDIMSSRAVLAHEYYGHRVYRGTRVPAHSWNDEFRASYMAAKNSPGLSLEDRQHLILDALERAKEKGVTIKPNDFIRRTLYGY